MLRGDHVPSSTSPSRFLTRFLQLGWKVSAAEQQPQISDEKAGPHPDVD